MVTKISAKTASRNRVSIITTTLIARARWGMMMKKNMENGPAPSMRAASLRSGSSAWMAVSRMSAAKGSHCQATMMMIEASGAWENQSMGSNPTLVRRKLMTPLAGCISMFFQTSALTVGMTKNGAIISTRATPRPKKS